MNAPFRTPTPREPAPRSMPLPASLAHLRDQLRLLNEADFKFFRRRPERRHRVRLAAGVEVVLARARTGISAPIPAGYRAFIGLKLVGNGRCRCVIGFGQEGLDTDLTEAEARDAFEQFRGHDNSTLLALAAPGRQHRLAAHEARLEAGARLPGKPLHKDERSGGVR